MKITIEADLPHEKQEDKEVLTGVTAYLVAYATAGNIVRPGKFPLIFENMKIYGLEPRAVRHGLLDLDIAVSQSQPPSHVRKIL